MRTTQKKAAGTMSGSQSVCDNVPYIRVHVPWYLHVAPQALILRLEPVKALLMCAVIASFGVWCMLLRI